MPSSLRLRSLLLAAVVLLSALAVPARAQDLLSQFEPRVTTFELDNGLTFVVVERRDAPVASFHTYADVGGVDEQLGLTGLAHMFEHMAFKGTTSLGTTNIEAELALLNEEEALFQELRRLRRSVDPDTARLAALETAFQAKLEEAKEVIEQNAFDRILQQAGMTGLNASTSSDATRYYYSLPSNKVELFFALESDRFLNPVLREFYQERDVVMEERRMRTESSPIGQLIEEFTATAFKAHPYGQPVIGHMSDLENLSRTDAKAFFDDYYNAANLTIGIAGDVDPAEARQLAQQYFGELEPGTRPPRRATVEPEQEGERRVVVESPAQPWLLAGYHRPSMFDEDDVAYDILADVLGAGRTSRLHKALVETEMALNANAIAAFPGSKYASLFMVYALPTPGTETAEVEETIYAELDRIAEEGITAEELERAKTRAYTQFVGFLDSNSSLAGSLAQWQALTGDWRNLFRQYERLDEVTVEDVQRVARETFERSNRTVGIIVPPEDTASL